MCDQGAGVEIGTPPCHADRAEPCQRPTHLQQVAAVDWSTGEGG